MAHAGPDTVLGAFDGRSVEYFDETARFTKRGDNYVVSTLDADGQPADFRVAYTFGVEPIQQYLVEFPGGRLQALPWLWDTRAGSEGGQQWLHLYPDDYVAPGDSLHWTGRRQNWNYMCAECHSTNVVQAYDSATDTFATTYDEISVGCEACHGPGSVHIAQAEATSFDADFGLEVDLDDQGDAYWVMNAATGIAARSTPALSAPQQPESCGRCHARRGTLDEPYRYGQPLAGSHAVSHLDDGLYFPDGQILDEVYVYGSFVQSRMYQAGVTCSNCHDAHSGDLLTGAEPNDVCAQCHAPAVFAAVSHQGHRPEQAGCVDCHMTARTYMVVDDRRDHSFRIPRPDLGDAGGPHACASCHADQAAEWAAAAIAGFSDAPPRPTFAPALAAGRRGHANRELRAVAATPAFPGIARASALELLKAPLNRDDASAIVAALEDPDPYVRIGALRALRAFGPEEIAGFAAPLLGDRLLSVRIEAAMTFASAADYLDGAARRAFDAAAAEFRRSRLQSASQTNALLSLANFEVRLGNADAAEAAFARALYIEPGWSVVRVNYADFLRSTGADDRGEKLLREGLLLDDDDASLHHALGLLLVRSDRRDEGLDALARATALDDDNARYAFVYGVGLNSVGQAEVAVDVLTAAYRRHPTDFDIGWTLATMLLEQGNLDRARELAGELGAAFPGNPQVERLRATLDAAES